MSANTSYRPDIQGLRAIAVAIVVCAHAKVSGMAGGFVGVDVFFVLSGYLITGLLLQELNSTGTIRYVAFLARRLRRLLPALLAMLIVALLAATLLLSAYETRMQSGSLLFSATWVSNIFFAVVDRDYFSALQSEDLYLHTWSLGVEEQFYVVWPWLLLLTMTVAKNRTQPYAQARRLFVALSIVFFSSLALCLYWSTVKPLLSFYMMPSRGWQFALGAAVYVWLQNSRRELPAGQVFGATGLLLILGSAVLLNSRMVYPGYFALFPSFGAAMVIAAGASSRRGPLRNVLESKPLVWLGDRSYSLYLWHWPILIIGSSTGVDQTQLGTISLVSLALLFAVVSYKLIELPFWKGRWSTATPMRSIAASLAAVLVVAVVSDGLKRQDSPPRNATTAEQYDPRWDASPAVYTRRLGCDAGHFNAQIVPCPLGALNGDKLAVLLGDSIGAQWSTLVAGIFSAPDWQVLVVTKSACAMVDEDYYYEKVGANYDVCTEWRNGVLEYIAEIEPNVVFVGNAAGYDFTESQWVDGSSRVLAKLSDAADQVVVIPGIPRLSFDGPSCLDEPYRFSYRLRNSNRECEEEQLETTSDDVTRYLNRSISNFANTHVLDLGDLVCPDRRCAARTEDGVVVFRDDAHLTMTFVNLQIDAARERLLEVGIDSGSSFDNDGH